MKANLIRGRTAASECAAASPTHPATGQDIKSCRRLDSCLALAAVIKLTALCLATTLASSAHAAPTKVGNGDDGTDLEGAAPLSEGRIVEARKKAVELLKHVNTGGVAGLGTLIPEVAGAPLYMTKKNAGASLEEDKGSFHQDMRGQVYARTFAEPHSPTRFFPVAEKLDEDQLIALHIHEGLHRALPPSVREDEATVAKITLAITSPEASHDQVRAVVAKELPEPDLQAARASLAGGGYSEGSASVIEVDHYPIPESARIKQPSLVSYGYTQFSQPKRPSDYPVERMHTLSSFLYPFGSDRTPLGIGLEASFLGRDTGMQAGPLGISARLRLWSGRGFDVGAWAQASLNMLSAEELKNSPLGRDVTTVGLSMRKDLKHGYIENFLSLSTAGEARQKLGLIEYTHSYGNVVNASMHAGASLGKLRAGGYAEVFLADYYRVAGGAFTFDSGRYRIFSGGPEVAWMDQDWSVGLTGKFLLDASKDANFDYLGNLMGQGVAQGSVALALSLYF